jgi:hypothetical protein
LPVARQAPEILGLAQITPAAVRRSTASGASTNDVGRSLRKRRSPASASALNETSIG